MLDARAVKVAEHKASGYYILEINSITLSAGKLKVQERHKLCHRMCLMCTCSSGASICGAPALCAPRPFAAHGDAAPPSRARQAATGTLLRLSLSRST
jgi:hypothetical protein